MSQARPSSLRSLAWACTCQAGPATFKLGSTGCNNVTEVGAANSEPALSKLGLLTHWVASESMNFKLKKVHCISEARPFRSERVAVGGYHASASDSDSREGRTAVAPRNLNDN